jgi:predicted transposase/invertase (TIGR01784 family)
MIPIGIRPTNDFAFKKTYGSPFRTATLISLLNALLKLPHPITSVTILNPFSIREFADDKLSVLDIRATDAFGNIYHVEMQVAIPVAFQNRMVYYGCQLYSTQLRAGAPYSQLKPVYSICLIAGKLWPDSCSVHQTFRLADCATGRVLDRTLEIHTLELGCYNLAEQQLPTASMLDRWLFWLLRAQDYSREQLVQLFPDGPIREATEILDEIAQQTEDKAMYDAREKKLRDQLWLMNATKFDREQTFREGRAEGIEKGIEKGRAEERFAAEVRMIQELQQILGVPVTETSTLLACSESQLRQMKDAIRNELMARRG